MEVLVADVAEDTADEHDGVQADAETGRVSAASIGGGSVDLRLGVTILLYMLAFRGCLVSDHHLLVAYSALQVADEELIESLASFVAVTNILKSLGGVLATDVEDDFLTTAISKC